jgi:hypothetical protein
MLLLQLIGIVECESTFSSLILLILVAEVMFHFGEVKVFAGASSENVQDVQASGLEVSRGIVRLGDENAVVDTVFNRLKVILYPDEPKTGHREHFRTKINLNSKLTSAGWGQEV